MKKSYALRELDCANCAAKLERSIQKVEGVQRVSVSFILQKMTIEVPDDRFEAVIEQVAKVCKRVEPDCQIQW